MPSVHGVQAIQRVFAERAGKPVFIAYITAGFPSRDHTVDVLLAMQRGGAHIM
jgi:tryptophan synthase